MNVGVVNSVDEAINHIAKFGTKHTEAIVTQSREVSDRFIAHSDCAPASASSGVRLGITTSLLKIFLSGSG